MEGGSIALSPGQRKRLLALYRKEPDPLVRLRAHVVLLLADGHAWSLICAVLFCSTATVARWKARFRAEGVEALLEERRGVASRLREYRGTGQAHAVVARRARGFRDRRGDVPTTQAATPQRGMRHFRYW